MSQRNYTLLIGLVIVIFIIVFIYLEKNKDQPIPNDGYLDQPELSRAEKARQRQTLLQPPEFNTRNPDDLNDAIIDDLVSQYTYENRPIDGGLGTFSPNDPMEKDYGAFNDYPIKRQLNMRKMEVPYEDDMYDHRDFSYKKKRFKRRTAEDIKDQFDVNKMLPQEVEEDWMQAEPLLETKKIKGTHLIHPKVHLGVNTVQSSLRNGTHDLRGDVPVPKLRVSPFNNSTIEPDTNIKNGSICAPI